MMFVQCIFTSVLITYHYIHNVLLSEFSFFISLTYDICTILTELEIQRLIVLCIRRNRFLLRFITEVILIHELLIHNSSK